MRGQPQNGRKETEGGKGLKEEPCLCCAVGGCLRAGGGGGGCVRAMWARRYDGRTPGPLDGAGASTSDDSTGTEALMARKRAAGRAATARWRLRGRRAHAQRTKIARYENGISVLTTPIPLACSFGRYEASRHARL